MALDPAIDELRQQLLDAIQANREMVKRAWAAASIDDGKKLAFEGRMGDSSNDLWELLHVIEPSASDLD